MRVFPVTGAWPNRTRARGELAIGAELGPLMWGRTCRSPWAEIWGREVEVRRTGSSIRSTTVSGLSLGVLGDAMALNVQRTEVS